ncbi:MAG: flavodoxin family protein [Chloroflexi bacterium]|nr:flavodoxin family protein [Chloroflexota bacterium]
MQTKILGICGSPRHGNTEIAVKEALAGAKEVKGCVTEFYTLAGKKLNPCLGDFRCGTDPARSPENPCPTWGIDDDIVKLVKHMEEFDGFVIGTPVYIGTITAQLKMLIDRAIMMTEGGELGPVNLRNKVMGVVVSAWDRNGGHDFAIADIWRWGILHDMPVIGVGPVRIDCNNYWAGCVISAYSATHPDGGKGLWFGEPNSEAERTGAKFDKQGLAQCRNVGRRVAELSKVIQAGFKALPEGETYWPLGKAGGFTGTGWGTKVA